MENLLAARLQMALSLGFHILFACIGMAMPFLMATAHYRWLKTGDKIYGELTKAWSRGVAIFFAVGAVSGTVLSFELGLLWPEFMKHAGPIIGMPFSWEGTAFFIEAIAIGLYLYGWKRLSPWVHWTCGVVVGVSGVASGFFVIAANAWMNSPAGFDWVDGKAVNIDPVAAMFNDAFLLQALHMTIAAFIATGFAVAGCHAILLLRGGRPEIHRSALKIALLWGGVFALLQPISGDLSAKDVAKRQPEKLAALESLFVTQTAAPLVIGGIPSMAKKTVKFGLEIPGLLSFLAHGDFNAKVTGLDAFPPQDLPPVAVVHIAFQIMVGCGGALALVTLLYFALRRFRPDLLDRPWFLWLIAFMTPLGFLAVEAGWVVTEVGRQPWIIYRVMRTADAVTPMPGIWISCLIYTLIYLGLSLVIFYLMRRQVAALERGEFRYE